MPRHGLETVPPARDRLFSVACDVGVHPRHRLFQQRRYGRTVQSQLGLGQHPVSWDRRQRFQILQYWTLLKPEPFLQALVYRFHLKGRVRFDGHALAIFRFQETAAAQVAQVHERRHILQGVLQLGIASKGLCLANVARKGDPLVGDEHRQEQECYAVRLPCVHDW